MNLALGETRIFNGLFKRNATTLNEVGCHFLELGTGESFIKVQRAFWCCGDEWQVDLCLLNLAQFNLGFFSSFFQTLRCHAIVRKIDTVCRLELIDQPINDALIPVVSTKNGVAVGALHFEHTVTDFKNRHVEGSATEVEHQNGFVFVALIEAVCQRCRGWLVDNAENFKTGDLTGFFGGGTLRVVKVSGNGNDCLSHGVAQVSLGVTLELHQGACADLLGRVLLAVDVFATPGGAHMALHRTEGAIGVGDGLTLGHFTNENFASFRESDNRRGCAGAF